MEEWLATLACLSDEITELFLEEEVEDSVIEADVNGYIAFNTEVIEDLSRLSNGLGDSVSTPEVAESRGRTLDFDFSPKLKCLDFDASSLNANKFAFKNLVSQFENCVINVKSGARRLQILKNHLTGYASQIVEHLTISDENFMVAMHLLTEGFLDQDCMRSLDKFTIPNLCQRIIPLSNIF